MTLLVETAIKGFLILASTGAVTLLLARKDAALRHLVWSIGVGITLMLPLLVVGTPRAFMSVGEGSPLSVLATRSPVDGVVRVGTSLSSGFPQEPLVPVPEEAPSIPAPVDREDAPQSRRPDSAATEEGSSEVASVGRASSPVPPMSTTAVLVALWLLGVAAVLVTLMAERLRLGRIARAAKPCIKGRLTETFERICRETSTRRTPVIRIGHPQSVPMTWGYLRPIVLLPAGAEYWSASRIESALEHELAHVRRGDDLAQLAAAAMAALHWFDPLAWVALWRMRVDREYACDDEVLLRGARPSTYAAELMGIVQSLRTPFVPGYTAQPMARGRNIRGRLLAVLHDSRCRRRLTRRRAASAAGMALICALPLSAVEFAVAPVAGIGELRAGTVDLLESAPAGEANAIAESGAAFDPDRSTNGCNVVPGMEESTMRRGSAASRSLLPAVLGLSACSAGTGPGQLTTVSDSAGVEIVQTGAPIWGDGSAWQVSAEPLLEIGQVEGDAPYLFGEVAGAIRIGETVIAADAQTLELRYFDLDGDHRFSVGGRGEGPGEFETLWQLSRCEGNLAFAFDALGQTVQVRDADGQLLREVRTVEPGSDDPRRPYTLECSLDGSGFVGAGWGDISGTRYMEPGTVPRQMAPVWLFDGSPRLIAELGPHLSSERVLTVSNDGDVRGSAPHPFGRATSFALGGAGLYVGSGETFSVDHYALNGQLRRRFKGPWENLLTDDATIAAYRDAQLDEDGERIRNQMERQGFPMPETLPAFTEMRLDPEGALWVKRFSPPGTATNRWGVFGLDGAFLGHVTLPDRLTLTDIGIDWVLGVVTDDLGVDRVRMYALDRTRG